MIASLLSFLLSSVPPDYWILPDEVAFDEEVINVVDKSSIKKIGFGVVRVNIVVLMRTERDRTSYLLGRREYACERYEYRDLSIVPHREDGATATTANSFVTGVWQDAKAGTASGVIGAMACGVFHDWEQQGFRKARSLKQAKAMVDLATSL